MNNNLVKCISLNVNGITSPVKRSRILSKAKKEQAQVVFLQETHLQEKEHEKLKKMGYVNMFSSAYKSGRRRGVVILISNKLNFKETFQLKDTEGRFILVRGSIEDNPVTLMNIYAPPGSDFKFYQKVINIMVVETKGLLICGGDLNIRLRPELDSSNGKVHDSSTLHKKVRFLLEEAGLIDIWRDLFPKRRDYTHYSAPHAIYTRIDYFITFTKDKDKIQTCDIGTIDISDHAPLYLKVNLDLTPKTICWKLNSSMLKDNNFKEQMKKEIKYFLDTNDNGEVSPVILWDTLKAVIRGKIIAIASYRKKLRSKKMEDLYKKLKELETKHKQSSAQNILEEIKHTRNEINNLNIQDVQKKMMFLKQKYYEGGSKSMKILAWKLRKKTAENTVTKIKDPTTKVIKHKLQEIHKAFETFYKTLYSKPPGGSENDIDIFLNSLDLPNLTEQQNEELVKDISELEIKKAINRLKSNKSPGSDGYTAEWYKELKLELIPILLPTLNWVLKKTQTPPSWKEAIITAIPKEGKDKIECASYRPISVLNIDYRLFTSIMARRLEIVLPKLIHDDQTGFIQNRQTQDNIRKTLHIIDYLQKSHTEAIIISVDAEKAFDSVNWDFLYKTLQRFKIHDTIIQVIKALYFKPTARIKINGCLSESFILQRGARQGCAWSPLLFAIFLEPLAQSIRQNTNITGVTLQGNEYKLACYADDILIYLTHPTVSLPKLMLLFEQFGWLSGYRVNVNKTQTLSYNYSPPEQIIKKFPMVWKAVSLKYLGINIPIDLNKIFESNYIPLDKKIKEDLKRWNLIPFFSLHSRIESIKMNILPRLLYLFPTLPIHIDQIQFNEWDKMISRYIWEGRRPRIRLKTLQLPKDRGGWGLPTMKDYYRAAQIKTVINWCDPTYMLQWKKIEENHFDIPIQAVLAETDIQKYIDKTDNPWVQCTLAVWKKVVKEYNLKNDIAILKWYAYDSDFKPNKLDTRFKFWTCSGITTLSKLIKDRNVISFEILKQKYSLEKQDFYRYLQVRHYINKTIDLTKVNHDLVRLLMNTYDAKNNKKLISSICKCLVDHKSHSTYYVKELWEKEGDISISIEEWTEMWKLLWKCTHSPRWKEFAWKTLIRYFITPCQKAHFEGVPPVCWRKCGNQLANHFHILWHCPLIRQYWTEVHNSLQDIFKCMLPFTFKTVFCCMIPTEWTKKDKCLLGLLIAASKKVITKKWLSQDIPTIAGWWDIVMEIYKMEEMTAFVNQKQDWFAECWEKWVSYIKHKKPKLIWK